MKYIVFLVVFVAFSAQAQTDYGPYRASLVRVIDGDSVVFDVHLWPGLTQRVNIRVDGINAPELRSSSACERVAGAAAKSFMEMLLGEDKTIILEHVRLGKFAGRAIADIRVGGIDVAEKLLSSGHARPYSGGKRKPWCR